MCRNHKKWSPEQEAKFKEILNEEHNPFDDLMRLDPYFRAEVTMLVGALIAIVLVVALGLAAHHYPPLGDWLHAHL